MNFKRKIIFLLAVIVAGISAQENSFAIERDYSLSVSKEYQKGVFSFFLKSDATTLIRVSDFSRTESEINFNLFISVKCENHNSKMGAVFVSPRKMDIDESFGVSTSGDNFILVDLIGAESLRVQALRIQTALEFALSSEPVLPGVGFNKESNFALTLEDLWPGLHEDLITNYTRMAFTDRKAEIIQRTTEFVLELANQE